MAPTGNSNDIGRRRANFPRLPKSLVGIDDAVEQVKRLIGRGANGTNRLGIVGMGGIGKTALAVKLFIDLLCEDRENPFDCSCFTRHVKSIKGSIEDTVLNLMHYGPNMPAGKRQLDQLSGKRILLVLDDVVSEKDLEIASILIDDVGVHDDSKIIVTSRDADLLESSVGKAGGIVYSVSCLDEKQSRQLLQTYTFPTGIPKNFKPVFNNILRTCDGLPLTLEIMGKYLHNKSDSMWEQAYEALRMGMEVVGLDNKLWAILKSSYDGLNKAEREMFLDAATVFHDADLEFAKAAWSSTQGGSQDLVWQRLVDLCLVKEIEYTEDESEFLDQSIKVGMHQQLLSLGKKIASTDRESGRRMWETQGAKFPCPRVNDAARELFPLENCSSDDVKDIVALKLSLEDFEIQEDGEIHCNEPLKSSDKQLGRSLTFFGMGSTPTPEQEYDTVLREKLGEMGKLRYLDLSHMRMDSTSGIGTLPSTLVSLQVNSANFTNLPFTPRKHKCLAILILESCQKLKNLPPSFGQLSSLQILRISGSEELKSLPDSLGNLAMLKDLKIIRCNTLEALPPKLGLLAKLERLVIGACEKLSALPHELCQLQKLKTLKIYGCKQLPELPKDFGNLAALEILVLQKWSGSLSALPESFAKLPSLKKLYIDTCDHLAKLPEEFGNLAALQHFVLKSCEHLQDLPTSFGRLQNLQKLQIEKCGNLRKLPDTFLGLQNLEQIILDWTSLSIVPDLAELRSLKALQVRWKVQRRCPQLPACLSGVIREENYSRSRYFIFNVVDTSFVCRDG